MNFFKSILSDEDPNPHSSTEPGQPDPNSPTQQPPPPSSSSSTPNSSAVATWSFGGLMKTLATQSESVIEIYRRDLREFSSGLQKETAVFKEVAGRAVKDLPADIDGVLKSTAQIISQIAPSSDGGDHSDSDAVTNNSSRGSGLRRYSRFDAQLRVIQGDTSTYSDEPEDSEDFEKWKLGFVLEEKREEINKLIDENEMIDEIRKSSVPNVVDEEIFWCRYFYRVYKLKQQEDVRANLVKRAISIDIDEELSWDVEDEEDSFENKEPLKGSVVSVENKGLGSDDTTTNLDEKKGENVSVENESGSELVKEENVVKNAEVVNSKSDEKIDSKSDEKVDSKLDEKIDNGGSCKDSDVSIVSTQPSLPEEEEEEDMGWDEIEDVGSGDEKKVTLSGSPNRDELRKRLSAADEDEDLSWDIEDDDEPIAKAGAK